jgi:transcription elongation factor Elf1
MEDLQKYYTSVGISLLSIFDSLEKDLKKDELSGVYDAKREEKFKIIEMSRDQLKKNAAFRKDMTEKQKIADQHILDMRTNLNCPKCKAEIVADIIGECEGETESGATLKYDILECPICNAEIQNDLPNNWADILTYFDLHTEALKMIIANPKKYPIDNARKQEMLRVIKSSKKQREIIDKPYKDLAHDWKIVEKINSMEQEIYDDWDESIKSGFTWGELDVPLN